MNYLEHVLISDAKEKMDELIDRVNEQMILYDDLIDRITKLEKL